jgi:predicted nuclease of predicted toxin-antitoxin system
MRILADEDIPHAAAVRLRADGPDVLWVRESCPGVSDAAVVELAASEQRVFVTFDKDFGDLAISGRGPRPAGVVLYRVSMQRPPALAATISATLASRDDWRGHIAVIDDTRIRMRPVQGPGELEGT